MPQDMELQDAVLDFSDYIAERTDRFTGREWLFDKIDRWLDDPEAPSFLILAGEPGIGKSAIAARLTQFSDGSQIPPNSYRHIRKGFISAYHFCSTRRGGWIAPDGFARSLSAQMALKYPGFARGIARELKIKIDMDIEENLGQAIGVYIAQYNAESSEFAFNNLVREPLKRLKKTGDPADPILILIDGLDESLHYRGHPNIVDLLSSCYDLPPQVRVLLTCRRKEEVLGAFRPLEPVIIYARSEDNMKDVQRYISGRLDRSEKLRQMLGDGKDRERIVEALVKRSKGNFLVVSKLLEGIERHEIVVDDPGALPSELKELYAWFLDRLTKREKRSGEASTAPFWG